MINVTKVLFVNMLWLLLAYLLGGDVGLGLVAALMLIVNLG